MFFNLIKNSIESIQERHFKNPDFAKKIDIVIINKSDYIEFIITDNGTGFSGENLKDILFSKKYNDFRKKLFIDRNNDVCKNCDAIGTLYGSVYANAFK